MRDLVFGCEHHGITQHLTLTIIEKYSGIVSLQIDLVVLTRSTSPSTADRIITRNDKVSHVHKI